ncbi:MAG: hypothetical protein A3J06_04130 [Candidatus Moranbacteria bacterium RIFCSPLOWO2_02_FULL_48_19]|nr:MAG: hypothetical protein UV19_C0017G0008 [Parcubacteria group bacterium GW2011_GWA2_42_28]OGI20197.1 MAG: hypothetical protein A3J06_04130 [Candidatus Moranbacteria bacterium RIFCSPLOWO2_02_FULL_48_19]
MKTHSFKGKEGDSEPANDLSSLLDVAQEVDTDKSPKNDPATTISSDTGEVINLGEKPSHTKD